MISSSVSCGEVLAKYAPLSDLRREVNDDGLPAQGQAETHAPRGGLALHYGGG